MTVPPGAALLDLWEQAGLLGPVERAVALAAAAPPPAAPDEVAALPVGRRDARLLRLRTALAGPSVEAPAACPACGEQAALVLDAADLLAAEAGASPPGPLEVDGAVVRWRPPDSRDLAAAAATGDPAAAEQVLLHRCVTGVEGEIPEPVRAAVADAMAAADPLAEVLVDVTCPSCATAFAADLDLAALAWAEVSARARRLLHDVDLLARSYGWTEAEILALGETRRATYVGLALDGGG